MAGSSLAPLVSIVMPVRNEACFLERALSAIDEQDYPADSLEIFVVDGGSTDATLSLATSRAAIDHRIRVLGGSGVNTPEAMNLGIEQATGRYVAKVDGHGWINETFIATAVRILESEPGVACVGGEIVPMAETGVERAIRVARFSKLGVGGGIYTAALLKHDIDTVQCGVYRKDVLLGVGAFDPAMQFGEDEEVNHRIREAGFRIVFEPTIRFHYRVRPSLQSLLRQYFNYGRARVAVVRKHPSFLRPKHLVPSALIVVLTGSLLVGLVNPVAPLVTLGGYGAGLLVAGAVLAGHRSPASPILVAAALGCLHLGYGLGVLRGISQPAPRR